MKVLFNLLFIALSVSIVFGKKGFGPTDQEWDYVTVRKGAHMFWWLHYTTAKVDDPTSKPLVIWLQGGPGSASTGYGNFGELGPLDEYLNVRDTAWTNDYNVLFVDNPVGTGYSYTDSYSYLTTNNSQIAEDFLVLMQNFYKQLPKFSKTPLYIFTESYGGKMGAQIALTLYNAQKQGKLNSNIKGVGLGDSWISPVDSCLTWGPYLLSQGLVDQIGYEEIQKKAEETAKAVADGRFREATDLWSDLESVVTTYSHSDFYNILTKISYYGRNSLGLSKPSVGTDESKINELMLGEVAKALNVRSTFGRQGNDVFEALSGDFMRPVTDVVERLINETDLQVVVYNGQLDLIVDTPGTIKWVDSLKWDSAGQWKNTEHTPIVVDQMIEGFYKQVERFSFYWVSRAGHMVPHDNPAAMSYILKKTTGQ
ncbi:hypothetical protein WA026_003904 [Henosepilachna vigintioctopunctata]|uniref:Carboxypeptidase n=1 Tax=Henosepilachna vigintioctopunctata TaxID=420089 RepID=A0AAW1UDN4_9CUCU